MELVCELVMGVVTVTLTEINRDGSSLPISFPKEEYIKTNRRDENGR